MQPKTCRIYRGGGTEIEPKPEPEELTFDKIFPNKDALAGITEDDSSRADLTFSIKDAEGDQPEKLVFNESFFTLEFPITSFEDKGGFYYAKIDKPREESEYAFVMFPKDVNLSYSNFYGIGIDYMNTLLQFAPVYTYNPNYKIDIASVDETMNFSGKSLLNFTYDVGGDIASDQRVGDVNLTINNGGEYDLTMNFDNFYTINTDGKTFTLSNGDNLSEDLETKLSFVQENKPYDVNLSSENNKFVLLGKNGIPEEVVGDYVLSLNESDNGNLSIFTSFGAVRK